MRKLVVVLLTSLGCSEGNLKTALVVPDELCGQPCAPGDKMELFTTGECKPGVWKCSVDGGNDRWCYGYTAPTLELCNGLDDDCDGRVDNDTKHCIPEPEICNGIDDDLDGDVDEGITPEYCYTGPSATLAFGECHPGTLRCIGGVEGCVGEHTPSPEVCDGLDNNCDGRIDEGTTRSDVDIVVLFDNSCSMYTIASTLKQATVAWVRKYSTATEYQYALVTAPDDDEAYYGPTPHLFQNLTDAPTFAAAMAKQSGGMGSYLEATLDALKSVTDPANPMQITWRRGARCMIVSFSDEEPQSEGQNTGPDVMKQLAASPCSLYAFTRSPLPDWDALAAAGHGKVLNIDASEYNIETQLDELIQIKACQ